MSLKYDSVKMLRQMTTGFLNRLQGGWGIEMGKNPKGTFLISIIQLCTCSPVFQPCLSGSDWISCLLLHFLMGIQELFGGIQSGDYLCKGKFLIRYLVGQWLLLKETMGTAKGKKLQSLYKSIHLNQSTSDKIVLPGKALCTSNGNDSTSWGESCLQACESYLTSLSQVFTRPALFCLYT